MARICSICVCNEGIKGSQITEKNLSDDEAFYNHMEEAHGIIVKRKGESGDDAEKRCAAKGIVPDESRCQCQDCRRKRQIA